MQASSGLPVSCPPFDEIFPTSESNSWVQLAPIQIQDNLAFFDSDAHVSACHRILRESLLSGSVILKLGSAGTVQDGPFSRWFSGHSCRLIDNILRHRAAVGFVACTWVDHELYNGEPVVLDLSQVHIKYRLNFTSQADFAYFMNDPHTQEEKQLLNVHTYVFDAPDRYGNLRSMMTKLKVDHAQEMAMNYFELLAIKSRAIPTMITEQEKEQHDPNGLTSSAAAMPSEAARRNAAGTAKLSEQQGAIVIPLGFQEQMFQTDNLYSATQPGMQNNIVDGVIKPLVQMPYFSNHCKLDMGRKFVPPPLPEAPSEALIKFRALMRQERVFNVMGVPLSMLTKESARTGGGGSKLSDGNNPQSFLLFQNTQQALKIEMINILTNLFYAIHFKVMLQYARAALSDEEKQNSTAKDISRKISVTIEIPSLPDEDRLIMMYERGWVKYEAFKEYLASRNGMPLKHFEETAQMRDNEGDLPATDATAPAKKSK